jgi:hypothetical protein
MAIVEYKLNINNDGVEHHPAYIKDHAYYDATTKTFLGYVLPESERNYWVPDTLVEVTLEQAITRCLSGDVSRARMPGERVLSNQELTDEITQWFNNHS